MLAEFAPAVTRHLSSLNCQKQKTKSTVYIHLRENEVCGRWRGLTKLSATYWWTRQRLIMHPGPEGKVPMAIRLLMKIADH